MKGLLGHVKKCQLDSKSEEKPSEHEVAVPEVWQVVWWRTGAVPGGVLVARGWVLQQERQWMRQKHFEDQFVRAWVTESEVWLQGSAVADMDVNGERSAEKVKSTV